MKGCFGQKFRKPFLLMRRKILSLMRRFVEQLLLYFSLLVKPRCGLIVFSMSRGRYWDNSRALFEYVFDNHKNKLEVIWLADPDLDVEIIPEKFRNKVVARNSIQGLFFCFRANFAIISHGFGDFGLYRRVAKRKAVINLWHGVGIKSLGLLDEKFNNKLKKKYISNEAAYYDQLICSSDIDRYYSASYTGMDVDAVKVTGLPRNDRLFAAGHTEEVKNEGFSILYAPTFRDFEVAGGSLIFPFPHDAASLAAWCRDVGIRFILRPHPNDSGSVHHARILHEEYPGMFVDGSVSRTPDVMDLLICCDGIVTDYSSTYIDGLILDRPVTFVDYDRDRYMEMRGLAYDYELITPGPKVRTLEGFQAACEEMKEGAPAWAEHREFVRKMFFKHRDGNACFRVTKLIEGMISQ